MGAGVLRISSGLRLTSFMLGIRLVSFSLLFLMLSFPKRSWAWMR
jgi:hypothetical protein